MISQMIEKSMSLDANWKIYQIKPLHNGKIKTRFEKSTVESSITLTIGSLSGHSLETVGKHDS